MARINLDGDAGGVGDVEVEGGFAERDSVEASRVRLHRPPSGECDRVGSSRVDSLRGWLAAVAELQG